MQTIVIKIALIFKAKFTFNPLITLLNVKRI